MARTTAWDHVLSTSPRSRSDRPIMEVTDPSRIRLLIIEADDTLRTGLNGYFEDLGYQTTAIDNGDAAIDLLNRKPGYDLTILDLFLPQRDGWDILEMMRDGVAKSGILVLSPQADLNERLRCYRLGADDIVRKPFSMKELHARAKAILRRKRQPGKPSPRMYVTDDLAVDLTSQMCYRHGKNVPLTTVEFELLKYLILHRGRSVSREELAQNLWSSRKAISPRTIDRHIAAIRKKVEDEPSTPQFVQTIYGEGYRFMPAE